MTTWRFPHPKSGWFCTATFKDGLLQTETDKLCWLSTLGGEQAEEAMRVGPPSGNGLHAPKALTHQQCESALARSHMRERAMYATHGSYVLLCVVHLIHLAGLSWHWTSATREGQRMNWEERIESYVRTTGFPRSLFISEDGRLVGTWIMGNNYQVKSRYYGGYPAGYLRRIAALFPDRKRVLHVFSGKVELSAMPGDTVDCNPDVNPTWVADAHDLSGVPMSNYDLILADPPYSIEDAERYQTTMVKRNVVMRSLAQGATPGTWLVWLDQVLPMYRKDEWSIEATIGMWKSTNHRFRGITIFKRLHPEVVSQFEIRDRSLGV